MKIMIEVGCLTRGGAERVASLWANGFVMRGHTVSLVLNTRKDYQKTYFVNNKVNIDNIYSWLGMKLFWFLHFPWVMIWKLRYVIKKEKPDVIICVLQPWAEWSRKAIFGMNIPIINTEHNAFERPISAPLSSLETKRKYIYNQKYSHVTVLTEADKKCAMGRLAHVSVMPNPLAYHQPNKVPRKEKMILAAGRLSAWHYKGFDLLLHAWGKIAALYPEWTLVIAGSGDKKNELYLRNICEEEKIMKQTRFLGFCEDMLPVYQKSSIFVLSSRYEAFGLVLIEAMSQGCAPIACDYKGRQKEIVNSDSVGLICKVNDIDDLAGAISKMIQDDEYRHRIQMNAIVRSNYYNIDNIIEKWDKILRNVIVRM